MGGEIISLVLTKKTVTYEGDDEYNVTAKYNGGTTSFIPQSYSFDITKTNQEMQDYIIADLADKGWDNLSGITWGEV